MKFILASLAILCFLLTTIPAWAQTYENGPINGTTDAWTINSAYVVSDTFVVPPSGFAVWGFSFGVWEFPGDHMTSVDWAITSAPIGGTVYGQGTAGGINLTDKFLSTDQYGYNIDLIVASIPNVNVTGGDTYWLSLRNAVVPSGDPVYWDENSGVGCKSPGCPSEAVQYGLLQQGSVTTIGTIPSEAFTVDIYVGCAGTKGPVGACGLEPSDAPEASSFLLLGTGIIGLAAALRCKVPW